MRSKHQLLHDSKHSCRIRNSKNGYQSWDHTLQKYNHTNMWTLFQGKCNGDHTGLW